MHLYFRDKQLKLFSENPIDAPDLTHVEVAMKDEEKQYLKENRQFFLKNKKFIFGEEHVLDSAEQSARRNIKKNIMDELAKLPVDQKITTADLKNIFKLIEA